MEQQLLATDRKVLVEIVKLAQKRGIKGAKGSWKDFLNVYDRKFGACVSDPSKRPNDVLVAFLMTFTDDKCSQFLAQVIQCHFNRKVVEQLKQESPDNESLEQRLVRLTLEHPQYPVDYSFLSYGDDWLVTKISRKSKLIRQTAMVAVDCEMVLCEDGSEALVKVCVVDRDLQEYVNPGKAVTDYRSEITGVTAHDLEGVTSSLADIQKSLKKILSHGTILVGHSLNCDLQALKLDHARVIDTAYIFKYSSGPTQRKPALNNLCKSVLGCEVRKEEAPHNCVDDARAAMKLVLAVIERGAPDGLVSIQEDVTSFAEKKIVKNLFPLVEVVPDSVTAAKLFLHRIRINEPVEELHRAIPGDFAVESKPPRYADGVKYSAFAIFGSPEEANRTFDSLKGSLEMDSYGRSQILIALKLSNGRSTADIYIRKMEIDASFQSQALEKKKRLATSETPPNQDDELKKKRKIEHHSIIEKSSTMPSENHYLEEEIERLKKELNQKNLLLENQSEEIGALKKDLEISVLHKALTQLRQEERRN